MHLELIFKATHISENYLCYSQQSSECEQQSQINYSSINKSIPILLERSSY